MDKSADVRRILTAVPQWLEKASWTTPLLLDGHSEERHISAQPHL